MFSIPNDYVPGRDLQNENRSVFSKKASVLGSALPPKKKALGDISNTLLTKRCGTPQQKKPQIDVPSLKEKIYQKSPGICVSPFKIASDEPESEPDWDLCSSCDCVQEDDYRDLRPLEDRLSDADIVTLLRGMFGMMDSPPLKPDPALALEFDNLDIVNDISDELDWMKPLISEDYNDDYECFLDSDSEEKAEEN